MGQAGWDGERMAGREISGAGLVAAIPESGVSGGTSTSRTALRSQRPVSLLASAVTLLAAGFGVAKRDELVV